MATKKRAEERPDREKSSRELERELDATRASIDDTLDELQARLSPGQLLDQAVGYLRRNGPPEFARNLGRAVNENPLPVVMTAAGLTWLMVRSSRGPEQRPAYAYEDSHALGSATEKAGQAVAGARQKGREAARRAQEAGTAAADGTRRLADGASDAASRLRSETSYRAGQARRGFERTWDEEPLLAGVASFALGALFGAVLPPTSSEDEILGSTRDEALARAAASVAERTRDAAEGAKTKARKVGRQQREDAAPAAASARPGTTPGP
jgi:hypothetical protein